MILASFLYLPGLKAMSIPNRAVLGTTNTTLLEGLEEWIGSRASSAEAKQFDSCRFVAGQASMRNSGDDVINITLTGELELCRNVLQSRLPWTLESWCEGRSGLSLGQSAGRACTTKPVSYTHLRAHETP